MATIQTRFITFYTLTYIHGGQTFTTDAIYSEEALAHEMLNLVLTGRVVTKINAY